MNKHTEYLLDQILKYRKEMKAAKDSVEKDNNEALASELVLALSKFTTCSKPDRVLDEYVEYLLSSIEEYKLDTQDNPTEKEINELIINELVQALAHYNTCTLAVGA